MTELGFKLLSSNLNSRILFTDISRWLIWAFVLDTKTVSTDHSSTVNRFYIFPLQNAMPSWYTGNTFHYESTMVCPSEKTEPRKYTLHEPLKRSPFHIQGFTVERRWRGELCESSSFPDGLTEGPFQ